MGAISKPRPTIVTIPAPALACPAWPQTTFKGTSTVPQRMAPHSCHPVAMWHKTPQTQTLSRPRPVPLGRGVIIAQWGKTLANRRLKAAGTFFLLPQGLS